MNNNNNNNNNLGPLIGILLIGETKNQIKQIKSKLGF